MSVRILIGDVRARLADLPDESVQCVVTSPPYWGLRDYGVDGQLGLEPTPEDHVEAMVGIFREVRRVLRGDGVAWVNYGDCYASSGLKLKPKDLVGMPWRIAFGLQADGWYLRSDVIWHKPNPMPESVTDRPTKSHEYVFLMTKSGRYFYDADAVREKSGNWGMRDRTQTKNSNPDNGTAPDSWLVNGDTEKTGRNIRDVWTIPTQGYSKAHFATFPEALARTCIKAGSREGDTVLDPFGGAGTTGLVADKLNRDAILIELNPEYAEMARRRIYDDCPMFADVIIDDGDAEDERRDER